MSLHQKNCKSELSKIIAARTKLKKAQKGKLASVCITFHPFSPLVLHTASEILTHWTVMGHGVHAEGQFLLWVFVELLPHRKRFGNHLALLYPLGFIVTATNDPGRGKRDFW